jgi:hypothetical protein
MTRRPRARTGSGLLCAIALATLLAPLPSLAQQDPHAMLQRPHDFPDVPAGNAVLHGTVVDPARPGGIGGVDLGLYALRPDGSPGLRHARTNADGHFHFAGISNEPGIVYLISARYAEIPFGKRVVFQPGQQEVELVIQVSSPVSDASTVSVRESEIRIVMRGSELHVQEVHRLQNSGKQVIYTVKSDRDAAEPAFQARLPEGAVGFTAAADVISGGLERRDQLISFWGPVHPGEHELRYQYRLPSAGIAESETIALRGELVSGAGRLVVLAPAEGPELGVEGLVPGSPVEREGRSFRSLEARNLAPGWRLEGLVTLPPASRDASRLGLTRADLWIEFDDTALVVNQEHHLQVEGDDRLMGSAEQPLMKLELPTGAELVGLSPNSGQMGIRAGGNGGIAVTGPLAPGKSTFAYRYRVPVSNRAARFDLRFDRQLPQLNMLVADSGVVIEDTRLHRRRPFRSGTRTYLHREGFNIEPDETLSIGIRAAERGGLPRSASLALILLVGLAGGVFLFRPLSSAQESEAAPQSGTDQTSMDREAIYRTIRDLDHDFETGKITEADHQAMRAEMRARAVELLRQERSASGPKESEARPCPSCSATVHPGWQFCSACGADLTDGETERSPGTPG